MQRILLLTVTALVVFGLMAPAANADINGVGTVQGQADVGRHFVDRFTGGPIDCRKETAKSAIARGQGLFLPPVAPAGPTTNGVWSLHANFTFVGTPPGLQTGPLDVCGWVQHVGRTSNGTAVGPACGVSKGHSGRGQVNFVPARGLNLFDVGWKAEAGGTIPMTGKYQVWNGTKTTGKQKKNKWGNLLGQFQIQGGVPCLDVKNCPNQKLAGPGTPGCGAQQFTVAGTFELVQAPDKNMNGTPAEKEDVIRPKTVPPACKSTANGQCAYDSNKFGKEPAPAFKTD